MAVNLYAKSNMQIINKIFIPDQSRAATVDKQGVSGHYAAVGKRRWRGGVAHLQCERRKCRRVEVQVSTLNVGWKKERAD